ncbi:uncharacterized protein LOC134832355 [Culicoides brevitarsis]|uniref:uncharacterized protein LOC134832355 n=1 Tax=Culicoides brevitarsis TaxID=469753 RepID=UPI00307C1A25
MLHGSIQQFLCVALWIISKTHAKMYERCGFLEELIYSFQLSFEEASIWTCIAGQTNYNTAAMGNSKTPGLQHFGIFQINKAYCIYKPGNRTACRVSCQNLIDNDITDDFLCARNHIYSHYYKISGDGFNAWPIYTKYCKSNWRRFVIGCNLKPKIEVFLNRAYKYKINKKNLNTNAAKIYNTCELANELLYKHHIAADQIATFVCIAQHESGLNTSAKNLSDGDYGLFQINEYWCGRTSRGKGCGISCSNLLDSNIYDDVKCMKKIFDEYTKLLGNGYKAWAVYEIYCNKKNISSYTNDCFKKGLKAPEEHLLVVYKRPYTMSTLKYFCCVFFLICLKDEGNAKVFERCELARYLERNFRLSSFEAAMFTCIAERQSSLNSRALGSSWDANFHGIFQLSDAYWCTAQGKIGKVCGDVCDKFRDDDINDDFICARFYAYEEHRKLSGDGYSAWPSSFYCKANVHEYLLCLNYSNQINPEKPNKKKSITSHKIYNNCELAQDLVYKHDIPRNQVATWVCIAYHESRYNTSAVGHLNWDGSGDHGLFQISDLYWCGPGKACGVSCDDLTDEDISDDILCVKQIYAEHMKLSGNGFSAWSVYPKCRGDVSIYVRGCFSEDINNLQTHRPIPRPGITAPPKPLKVKIKSNGKIYSKCELAQELYFKHKFPLSQIGTWVCIVQHESSFNTSAIGRLNWDGSEDHGLFQISDIYWCGKEKDKKACNLTCDDLKNSDITDDVKCVKQIYNEHTLISGDGFNAWSVYSENCKGRTKNFIDECFDSVMKPRLNNSEEQKKTITKIIKSTISIRTTIKANRFESTKRHLNKFQTTTKKNIFNFYLNDFGKTSKRLPTFKPFESLANYRRTTPTKIKNSISSNKTTTKNISTTYIKSRVVNTPLVKQIQQNTENKKTIDSDSKPQNAYEYYVKYVLGGKVVTIAPYDFDYIKGLTKPTLKRF